MRYSYIQQGDGGVHKMFSNNGYYLLCGLSNTPVFDNLVGCLLGATVTRTPGVY